MTEAGLKPGSLAVNGTIAYNAFQKWQSQQAAPIADAGKLLTDLSCQASGQGGKRVLKAMIAAAKAGGHFDDKENNLITKQRQNSIWLLNWKVKSRPDRTDFFTKRVLRSV